MQFKIIDPLAKVGAPLIEQLRTAIRTKGIIVHGQIVVAETKLVCFNPIYTCITSEGRAHVFAEMQANGVGISFKHSSIQGYYQVAASTWNGKKTPPFPLFKDVRLESWIDFVLQTQT